jgi:hypothetical protein
VIILIIFWCGYKYVKCSVLYKGNGLWLTIWLCYSSEMAWNVGLSTSFDNIQNWKGIWENRIKANIPNDEISCWILSGHCTSILENCERNMSLYFYMEDLHCKCKLSVTGEVSLMRKCFQYTSVFSVSILIW